MARSNDATPPAKRVFHATAIALLLGAVATAFIQKQYEGAVAVAAARRVALGIRTTDEHQDEARRLIRVAQVWEIVGFALVAPALLSWGIAIRRREKHRWAWPGVVVLLFLYVWLKLLMV
ncbi:MAG TPA: hypothetical protein DD670_03645 [Planctomycetaceae bacterium]|nr:hypothetical protein [Planctomycetaceae bacterium]